MGWRDNPAIEPKGLELSIYVNICILISHDKCILLPAEMAAGLLLSERDFARRNGHSIWLFAGSDKGGDRIADILTIIETAKQHGLTRRLVVTLKLDRRRYVFQLVLHRHSQ